jgi:Anti-sigma-K factor rskA/Putative zinc-finger
MPSKGRADLAHPEVAGWMLGKLDPAEAEEFRAHLAGCPHCQAAVAELAPVGRALNYLPPATEPPPGLEARTIASVQAAAAAPERAGRVPSRIRWPRWNARLLAAAAAAAVVIAAVAVVFSQGGTPTRSPVAAVILLRSPSGGPATGRAVVTHQAGGWSIRLSVHGLRPLGPGRFYECWYASPDNRPGHPRLITAGTFTVGRDGHGTFTMWSAADPHVFSTMQITAEHPGNARQRGQIILTGQAQA